MCNAIEPGPVPVMLWSILTVGVGLAAVLFDSVVLSILCALMAALFVAWLFIVWRVLVNQRGDK